MKKFFNLLCILFAATLVFSSCNKDEETYFDPNAQFELEKPIIERYVKANDPMMEYSSDSTGMWFEVLDYGTADSYEYKYVDTVYLGSQGKMVRPPLITVRYTGKLVSNNSIFDSNISASEPLISKLNTLISAWYIAFIPKSIGEYKIGGLTAKGLQKGAKIRFVTPSYYAYGNRGQGAIPGNSPLYFEIEVIDIK